jgi:DNA-directed RNA polymerase subunit RPC12/RpoP
MAKAAIHLKDYKLNENEKFQRWEKIMSVRGQWFEKEYKRIQKVDVLPELDKKKILKEILAVASLESDGGTCFKCGREWQKIEFDNIFGKGLYYQPRCQCLFKCPCCKSHLYDYYVTTLLRAFKYKCPRCGWGLIIKQKNSAGEDITLERHGASYEAWYDNQRRKPKNMEVF